jgi:hypothetical protein
VDEEIPHARRLRKRVSIDAVIKACRLFHGESRKALVERTKERNERGQAAIYLAKILSGEKGKVSHLRERIECLKQRIIPTT